MKTERYELRNGDWVLVLKNRFKTLYFYLRAFRPYQKSLF